MATTISSLPNDTTTIKMKRITSTHTTTSLESQLRTLKERSQTLSQLLTQQLATSQSGQNLLHIGSSLSTLPPDLHSLLQSLLPLLKDIEIFEESCLEEYTLLKDSSKDIEHMLRRSENAMDCVRMYQDLVSAEDDVKWYNNSNSKQNQQDEDDNDDINVSCLERAALTTLHLVQELRKSTQMNNNNNTMDKEKAEFLIHLAPRVRRLESDSVRALSVALENLLQQQQQKTVHNNNKNNVEFLLKKIGCCLRGLALLGRGKEAESAFATTAIMPIIRSKVSMGRLDQGGPRGQCCGLFSSLDDILCSISEKFGSVIRLSETMFTLTLEEAPEIDLLVCGVWIPIVTALLTDPSIKMAIFSPGIASILQANYTAIDIFLSELADRLLSHQGRNKTQSISAQRRLYAHPSTSDFYHKWNLPIYYQLRFGEACTTLNKSLILTQEYGWHCNDAEDDSNNNTSQIALPDALQGQVNLPLFQQLYQILLNLWSTDVILRPLTHRFLRGAIQLLHRTLSFIKDGLNGAILFQNNTTITTSSAQDAAASQYNWSHRIDDLAPVAWELHLLYSFLTNNQYLPTIYNAVVSTNTPPDEDELQTLIKELFLEASDSIPSLISDIYNTHIVNILIDNCSAPLSAVKGVAATYRMTNRPPPTQPSPFISTILLPLQTFTQTHYNIIISPTLLSPPEWKQNIITAVTSKYHLAIQDLIETVKRTEVALKNRKSKKAMFSLGGMTDGEKVRLQLLLDYKAFKESVQDLGVDIGMDMVEMESSLAAGTD